MKTIHPRRLARQIAKAKLDNAGATGYNKQHGRDIKGNPIPSTFARTWKKIVTEAVKASPRKEKK